MVPPCLSLSVKPTIAREAKSKPSTSVTQTPYLTLKDQVVLPANSRRTVRCIVLSPADQVRPLGFTSFNSA